MVTIEDMNAEERVMYFQQNYGGKLNPEFGKEMAFLIANSLNVSIGPLDEVTAREEANVMTAYCFRNTVLEDYHADGKPIDDKRMKKLMIESSTKLANWLTLKHALQSKGDNKLYNLILRVYESMHTKEW